MPPVSPPGKDLLFSLGRPGERLVPGSRRLSREEVDRAMKPSADGFVPSRPVNPDSGEPLKRLEELVRTLEHAARGTCDRTTFRWRRI